MSESPTTPKAVLTRGTTELSPDEQEALDDMRRAAEKLPLDDSARAPVLLLCDAAERLNHMVQAKKVGV
jgi:hypothetical protein